MKTRTITKEMYVHLDKYNPGEYQLHSCDMTEYGYVLIDKVIIEVSFNEPETGELVRREVEMLKAKQAEVNGKAYAEVKALQNRIDSLLCIEHKEVAA